MGRVLTESAASATEKNGELACYSP